MKPFDNLTRAGKIRRLRQMAIAALAHYDLKDPEVEFFGYFTNLLFQVKIGSGERFMLRLASPGWRTLVDLQSEAMWLEALRRDTTIAVPRIFPARSGEYVLPLHSAGIPDVWNASLMSWVPGSLLGKHLTTRNLVKMGALFAELHHHGASWTPPAGFTTRRFEHWLSRGEENRILEDPGSFPSAIQPQNEATISPDQQNILARTHRSVEAAYAAVNRADLRVIHCDLWHDNIKVHQGVLHPIDFEDTVWGFRAHDIAMAMLDLLETCGEERYTAFLRAFRQGYEANLSWPADPIEPFQIGRLLWKIIWVARHEPLWLGQMINRHIAVFLHYEQTGEVILPPVG